METTRDAYKAKMEAQLKTWSARLDGLKAKATETRADAKIELRKQLDELASLEAAAKKQIAVLDASAAESWTQVKHDIAGTWDRLSGSVEALWSKIAPAPSAKN